MVTTMTRTEGSYPSSNQKDTIFYTLWMPDGNPRGIVQIVHGMDEYVERYSEFAEFLCENGLIVCGNDHLGHGRSAVTDEDLGYFADSDGDRCLVQDVETLRGILRSRYRALPYIIMGHSMGSFITRAYVSSHPDSVDAVILSGTAGGGRPFGFGKFLCGVIAKLRGKHYRSEMVKKIAFQGYNKRFKGDTGVEWVTNDPDKLSAYAGDPKCTFTFTVQGYRDLFTLLSYVNSDEWYEKMPKNLPILFFAGSDDPVGDYSNGVKQVAEKLMDADVSDVTVHIYEGERHEVLNGISRKKACSDILEWLDRVIEGIHAARTSGEAGR